MDARRLSQIGRALASETRAGIVVALMDGTAHTGQELARHLGVAPSTISEHLGVLIDAGLVTVAAQGRHRYFRLAGGDVAALLESTVAVESVVEPVPGPRVAPGLAYARSCYDHLAGQLGVEVYERLVQAEAIAAGVDGPVLTPTGIELFDRLQVDTSRQTSRPLVRACLDWTQRQHHLAGALGARLLSRLLDDGWLRRQPRTRRELQVTTAGRTAFATHLGIHIP